MLLPGTYKLITEGASNVQYMVISDKEIKIYFHDRTTNTYNTKMLPHILKIPDTIQTVMALPKLKRHELCA
jgi:hypothetical protein